MKENRSYDHLFGRLHEAGQPDSEPMPAAFTNLDVQHMPVPFSHAPTTCVSHDPDHQWDAMHFSVNGGKMDGFVVNAGRSTGSDGHFAMWFNDEHDAPFYYWVANTFALNDHHFPSALSGTFPNRNFLLMGTADGVKQTGAPGGDPNTRKIFDALDERGISWGIYGTGDPIDGTLGWKAGHPSTHPFGEFIPAIDDGTLPQVTFVDGVLFVEDEHPTADLQRGELWTRLIYEHVVNSKIWPDTAILWTYDEAGGFADHMPPPDHACIARPVPKDAPFFELGVRVPLTVISPWVKPHYVSHVVEDHTALTRFIETVFDLPALTARDANSPGLLDLFDFEHGPALLSPGTAPMAGTGGCATNPTLTTDKPTYASGDPITITFANAAGMDARDRIAVYSYPANGPTPPNPMPLLRIYVGGGQTPTSMPRGGMVTFDARSVAQGTWPLAPGLYIAYYLAGTDYMAASSVDFEVE
jgi:phospholipase C